MLAELLRTRTPSKPYCSDDASYMRPRVRETALRHPYIQINAPWLKSWLVVDIDREGMALAPGPGMTISYAATAWMDAGLPPPTWVTITPHNGRGHVVYGLKNGVHTHDDKQLRYFAAVQRGLRRSLSGDIGYADVLTKNPLSKAWRLIQPAGCPLYDLGDLAEYVDLSAPANPEAGRRERLEAGAGRNVALFDQVRHWAYRNVRKYRQDGSWSDFEAACLGMARMMNAFVVPLQDNEVRHTARSIAKWTWRNYTGQGGMLPRTDDKEFVRAQQERGKRSGEVRRAASEEKRATAILMAAKGMSQVAIAKELGVTDRTVRGWLSERKKKIAKKRTQNPRKPA